MGTQKLSHFLIDEGFFWVLGTTESGEHVQHGTPKTWDTKNGITVVYDEKGRPWIIQTNRMSNEALDLLHSVQLQQGAYVPHASDVGWFAHEVLTKLASRRPKAQVL